MSSSHTIRVVQPLEALGAELCDFVADIRVNCIPESGNGWDEPREAAFAELAKVTQVSGPYIHPIKLALWADFWVEANQSRIQRDVADSVAF